MGERSSLPSTDLVSEQIHEWTCLTPMLRSGRCGFWGNLLQGHLTVVSDVGCGRLLDVVAPELSGVDGTSAEW